MADATTFEFRGRQIGPGASSPFTSLQRGVRDAGAQLAFHINLSASSGGVMTKDERTLLYTAGIPAVGFLVGIVALLIATIYSGVVSDIGEIKTATERNRQAIEHSTVRIVESLGQIKAEISVTNERLEGTNSRLDRVVQQLNKQ